jgi:chromosome segregation ATPase
MRFAILVALIATIGATAQAQDRGPYRGDRRDRHDRRGGVRPPPDPARMCSGLRTVLESERSRYETLKSDVVGFESEMSQLQKRIDELRRQRADASRDLADAEARYKEREQRYGRECRASDDCSVYDARAEQLDQQTSGIEATLDTVRQEIRKNRDTISALERTIAPLQREYGDKACNAMVPGETEQSVIDRCMGIFSEWNRLQSELNRQNARVPDLRSRFEQLYSELKNLESRAAEYESYLSRSCSSSPQIARMRGFGDRRVRARSVGDDLDQLVGDLTKLRGVKITVAPR